MAILNGKECNSLLSTVIKFLNLWQDGTYSTLWFGFMLKNNDALVE